VNLALVVARRCPARVTGPQAGRCPYVVDALSESLILVSQGRVTGKEVLPPVTRGCMRLPKLFT
jgi:hypothetical protein